MWGTPVTMPPKGVSSVCKGIPCSTCLRSCHQGVCSCDGAHRQACVGPCEELGGQRGVCLQCCLILQTGDYTLIRGDALHMPRHIK